MMTKKQITGIIAGSIALLIIIIALIDVPEKPNPKFENGDMVTHSLSGKTGQVIDNTYKFNKKSGCWMVRLRLKSDVEKTETLSKKISKWIDDAPLTFNEFELEKR